MPSNGLNYHEIHSQFHGLTMLSVLNQNKTDKKLLEIELSKNRIETA